MEPGKIYFISYGPNTSLVVRFKANDGPQYKLFDYLHYWQGYENFHSGCYCFCLTSGVEEIREATDAEKHNLLKHCIANKTI